MALCERQRQVLDYVGGLSGRPTECRYCRYLAPKGRWHGNLFRFSIGLCGVHIGATWRIRLNLYVPRRCAFMSNYFDHLLKLFHGGLIRKVVIEAPPHLKRVHTLPCEIYRCTRNRHAQELSETNCHARLELPIVIQPLKIVVN